MEQIVLDFYNAGGVLQHSITYDSNDFNIGGGSIVEIDAIDSVIVSNSGVGIATFTENGLNVTGVVTATSFEVMVQHSLVSQPQLLNGLLVLMVLVIIHSLDLVLLLQLMIQPSIW